MMDRKEYPRPQFRRGGGERLDGEWEFAIDGENGGAKHGEWEGQKDMALKITGA